MEKITISDSVWETIISLSDDSVMISQESGDEVEDVVVLNSEAALQLATALYAKYAEWKTIHACPYNELVWLKEDDNICMGVYYGDGRLFTIDGAINNPTHYTEILKPNV